MATQRITRSTDRATAEASNSANGTDYTDLTLENPNSRPIPTSKRAREEELERLALEEQRLRVFKLRKEIALIKEPSRPADNGDDDEETTWICQGPRECQTLVQCLPPVHLNNRHLQKV